MHGAARSATPPKQQHPKHQYDGEDHVIIVHMETCMHVHRCAVCAVNKQRLHVCVHHVGIVHVVVVHMMCVARTRAKH